MSRTVAIEHLARVEGHGGIVVETDGSDLRVRFDIFEGTRLLESLVRGRSYDDLPQILSRICAICSTAHALTSIKAIENAFGVEVSPQTNLLRELMFLGENIESHALHLFLLALPDYLDYAGAAALSVDKPELVKLGLRLKKLGNSIQETVGGRAIHPVNAIPGGFGRLADEEEWIRLRRELMEGVSDAGVAVELIATLPSAEFCRSEAARAAVRPAGEYGYYGGELVAVQSSGSTLAVPASEYTSLVRETAVPHSHAKHSFFGRQPVMVGALARLSVNDELVDARTREVMDRLGLTAQTTNPMDNNKAQAVELARDIPRALQIVEALLDDGVRPEPPVQVRPRGGAGAAATEAPRGLLVHRYGFDDGGRLVDADIVTPTAINAAGIELSLRRAVEQASGVGEAVLRKRLEMIARAYDPCISCSVH
jgi:sulfhydrogenase subunit alpha